MPPFQSRSTGALRIARSRSLGAMEVAPSAMPRTSAASALTGMDFAVRGYTPPPAEISVAE